MTTGKTWPSSSFPLQRSARQHVVSQQVVMALQRIRGTVQYRTDKLHQGCFSGFVVTEKNRDVFWDLRDAQIAPNSETINLESGEFQCDISSSFQIAVTQVAIERAHGRVLVYSTSWCRNRSSPKLAICSSNCRSFRGNSASVIGSEADRLRSPSRNTRR